MGMQSVAHACLPNFLAAWVRDLPQIAAKLAQPNTEALLHRIGPLETCLQNVIGSLTSAGVDDIPTLSSALESHGKPKLASHWRSALLARCKTQVESGSTTEQVVALRASSGSGAGAWMGVPSKPGHYMSDQEVTTAVRLRMCAEVFDNNMACNHHNQDTVCGASLDTYGLHALICRLGGHVIRRHNRLRYILADIISTALESSVHVEQHIPGVHEDNRRPDISYADHRGMRQWIDVAVVTPHERSLPGQATSSRVGALCESMEAVKRRKYHMLSLTPAVMEHLGHMGKGLCTIIRAVHRHADPFERSRMVDTAYQSMAVALQRANVTLLAAAGDLKA